jgi:ribosomal protein S12 methylthiotransferase accessory factor YcaO
MIEGSALPLFNKLLCLEKLPKKIEFARAGHGFFATVYNYVSGEAISQSVCTGYASTQDLALQKALTEYIERKAYSEAYAAGHSWALKSSTDGFAAFPILEDPDAAAATARLHAIQEATERYSWATWWDCPEIDARVDSDWRPSFYSAIAEGLAVEIEKRIPVSRYYLIEPEMNEAHFKTTIIFAKIEGGGFVSGGACELAESKSAAIARAMAELTRHALALVKLKRLSYAPESLYEQKLKYFGTGQGDELVIHRIENKKSKTLLKLPPLEVDTVVNHSLSEVVAVHRCLFVGQPQFVAGSLERLCL